MTFGAAPRVRHERRRRVAPRLDRAGRLLRTTPVPVGSYNVQYGFGRVITASLNRGTLAVLDRRGALLARIAVSDSCHDACLLGP